MSAGALLSVPAGGRLAPIWKLMVFVMLGVVGCGPSDRSRVSGSGAEEMRGWSLASGKRPSRAEYTAMVASCEQGAVRAARGRPLEACLADLGLRRE